jgi:hypothetical protein
MPRADYWGLLVEVAEILRENIPEAPVVIEEELMLALEMSPRIGVYLDSRTYPSAQPLAAGRISRIDLRLSVWVWCGALELVAAVKARDELVARVEEVLILNRTFHDKAVTSWLEGGELPSSRLPNANGFICGGEVAVHVELRTEV